MNDAQTVCLKVIREILEQFAFMFSEINENSKSIDPGEFCARVSINFSGSRNGMISLIAPQSLCNELAGNVLGLAQDEVALKDGCDALKELVNVVCGKLLSELFGDKELFNLSVPSFDSINKDEWFKIATDPVTIQLWVEDQPMLTQLSFS